MRIGNNLMHLSRTNKKQMIGFNGILLKINNVPTRSLEWPYNSVVIVPVRRVGNAAQFGINLSSMVLMTNGGSATGRIPG